MGYVGEDCYNLGVELFEGGNYEQAVKCFIQAYNFGYERQQILENLYNCFVLPNEQEFENNYKQNSVGITKIPFKECILDFIPVSEKRFYIFDKERLEFAGVFELEDKPLQGEKEEFDSVLYADIWDIREMLPSMKERKWNLKYIVLNEGEARFSSFLKLPKFAELYLRNVAVFQDTNLMCAVFEQYDEFYLPKSIVARNGEEYLKLINDLHIKRTCKTEKDRTNIFLSICIPSYNRGSFALKNVYHLLQCPYDSEIEIIVSNNGSIEDAEGYQEIAKIKDARIRYHEFKKNQGYASNVLKTLELARGKYAVLASDEDLAILKNMGEYLSCLKANPSCGFFYVGRIGVTIGLPGDMEFKAGLEAINGIINLNYMTGFTFNMEILKKVHVFDVIEKMRGNIFLEYYVHLPLALIMGTYANVYVSKLILWDVRNAVELKESIPKYMLPETRIAQQNSIMDFFQKGINIPEKDFVEIFLDRSQRTFFLLELAYGVEKFREIYAWEEICFFIYGEHIKYLNGFPIELSQKEKERIGKLLQEMFFEYLNSEKVFLIYPLKEQEKRKMLYREIQREFEEGKGIKEVEADVMEYLHLSYTIGKELRADIIETTLA